MGKKKNYGTGGGSGRSGGGWSEHGSKKQSYATSAGDITQTTEQRSHHDRRGVAIEHLSTASAAGEVEDRDIPDDVIGSEDELDSAPDKRPSVVTRLWMWEFGQNDPKRDSGSKLRRLGYASSLKIGQSFPGVVLSSEAKTYLSPADLELVQRHGIGGINCSWNRLSEIPFAKMGNGRTQRILPLLFAANSVNYGRPFKMNTAEAMAASLYIVGLKEDATNLLYPFGYGEEFIRLNFDALEAYSACTTASEVEALHTRAIEASIRKKTEKELRNESDRSGCGICTDYLGDMDMPPRDEDNDVYDDTYEDEEEKDLLAGKGVSSSLCGES